MRVLVITSCTGEKAVKTSDQLAVEDFDDPVRLAAAEARLHAFLRPACAMYTGDQHVRAMRGVRAMRSRLGSECVTVAILSAGYGIIDERRLIAPYNVTFSGMSASAIKQRGARLGVPGAVHDLLPGHDLAFFLLGDKYLTAVAPPLLASGDERVVYFARPSERRIANTGVLVPAGTDETRRYGAGNVALKGRMLELIGAAVCRGGTRVLDRIKADPTANAVLTILGCEATHT
jgi:hypothetical protein